MDKFILVTFKDGTYAWLDNEDDVNDFDFDKINEILKLLAVKDLYNEFKELQKDYDGETY